MPVYANGNDITTHKTVAHRVPNNSANYSQSPAVHVAQGDVHQQSAPIPGPQKQAAGPHNCPISIGVVAAIGRLLGNQVGSGDGKTLATIAGAVSGGYARNEVEERNQ